LEQELPDQAGEPDRDQGEDVATAGAREGADQLPGPEENVYARPAEQERYTRLVSHAISPGVPSAGQVWRESRGR